MYTGFLNSELISNESIFGFSRSSTLGVSEGTACGGSMLFGHYTVTVPTSSALICHLSPGGLGGLGSFPWGLIAFKLTSANRSFQNTR